MNGLYDAGRNAFLTGDIDWVADDIRVILVDSTEYTVDLAAHEFLDDVPSGSRIATSGALANKTAVAGVADADDVTFTAVAGPDSGEALVIYQHTGVEGTSQLIAYIDTGTGLPVTANGGDIIVTWDSGANKIFKL